KIEMGRHGKRLRLLEQEERHPAEIRITGHHARSWKHPPAAVHGQLVSHDAALAAGSGRREVAFSMLEIRADLALPILQARKTSGGSIESDGRLGARADESRDGKTNAERFQHLQPWFCRRTERTERSRGCSSTKIYWNRGQDCELH